MFAIRDLFLEFSQKINIFNILPKNLVEENSIQVFGNIYEIQYYPTFFFVQSVGAVEYTTASLLRSKTPLTSVLDMTLNNLIVRLQ